MDTSISSEKLHSQNNEWEVSVDKESIITNNDVIDAYLKGKEEGVKKQEQLFFDKLRENINKSTDLTQKMLTYLKDNEFNVLSAHLKILAFNDFVILVTLPEDEYISEKISIPYTYASTIEEEVLKDKYYNVMFTFSDRDEETFNKSLLTADGFFLNYKMNTVDA